MKTIRPKIKGVGRKPARLLRKPSSAKRLVPLRFRAVVGAGGLLLGAGGLVVALVRFLVVRKVKP